MIELFAERKQGIAATALAGGRQRAASVAAQLSRRGLIKARAELCNEAVGVLIKLVYQGDTTGAPCNIDVGTGRLLISAPWGKLGHRFYGLRSTEGKVLRSYMFDLQSHAPAGPPLFTYDPLTRSWGLNMWDFPSMAGAVVYWERWGLTEGAYRDRMG